MSDPGAVRDQRGPVRALFVFTLLVFTLFAHGYIDNPDAEAEFQTARSMLVRGSTGLSVAHEDASTAERLLIQSGPAGHGVMEGVDGRYYSWYGIGHAVSMIPFELLGFGVARVFPGVEQSVLEARIRENGPALGRAIGEDFFARFFVSLHSPVYGALLMAVMFVLLGHFGWDTRTRVIAVLIAGFATQLGPETRESMSDTESALFLLWSLERALAFTLGGRGKWALLSSGALAGFAVASRNFHVLAVLALTVYLVLELRRRGAVAQLRWFIAGGLPFGVWLLWFNYSRFGNPLEFGYAQGTSEGYWSFPPLFGLILLIASPGKGALLFSPALACAPAGLARMWRDRRAEVVLLACYFAMPWFLSSFTTGWHSSQAWACRYMTPGVVLLVSFGSAAILASGGPWARRALFVCVALGFVINLGGWLAPYRGFYELANRAAPAFWPDAGDRFQNIAASWTMSPTYGHWLYVWNMLDGRIPNGPGPELFESMFGRALPLSPALTFPDDTGFRHIWWIGLGRLTSSSVPFVLGVLLCAAAGWAGVVLRRAVRDNPVKTPYS